VESNFRLLAATNRDLDQAVAEGTFRKDLLFRLRSLSLNLPPLRDRLEDIKELVLFHTGKLCESYGIPQKGFAPEFFECLLAYDWPGNVRELINTLDWAIAEARHEPTLYPNLPSYIRVQAVRNTVTRETPELSPATAASAGVNLPKLREYREAAVAQAEREYLKELMVLANNDLQEACRISDLSQPRLYALLKKHRISRVKVALEKE
jgi:two-component system NtrC family response regulator